MLDKLVIGCGYLGKRVAARWRQQGHRVFATTRCASHAEEMRQQGWEPVLCDVTQPETLRSLPKVDSVVHCVGLDRAAGSSMRAVYVDGLRNVLQRSPPPSRFCYVSSTSVYGQSAEEAVDESSSTEPELESGRVVLDAERVLRDSLRDAIVLRFAGIYGPGRLLRADAILRGEPVTGDPEHWLNLIHVEDGVAAVLAAEENGRGGETYNVSDGAPVRRRDFFHRLAELMHAPPVTFSDVPASRPANRRIINRRLLDELNVELQYADYRTGLVGAVRNGSAPAPDS